jgi:hypothetical protein
MIGTLWEMVVKRGTIIYCLNVNLKHDGHDVVVIKVALTLTVKTIIISFYACGSNITHTEKII